MRGRHKHHLWCRAAVRHQSLLIHGHRPNLQAIHAQQIARSPVAWLLHPDPIARIAQHPRHQINRLMNPFGDQDLVSIGPH